jgi:hypothetical protein
MTTGSSLGVTIEDGQIVRWRGCVDSLPAMTALSQETTPRYAKADAKIEATMKDARITTGSRKPDKTFRKSSTARLSAGWKKSATNNISAWRKKCQCPWVQELPFGHCRDLCSFFAAAGCANYEDTCFGSTSFG